MDVVVVRKTGADLFDIGQRMRERAVWRSQVDEMLAEGFELGQRKCEFGVFVRETIKVLRGLLKIFHRVSRFSCNWFDNFEHFCCGFSQIGCAFAGEYFAIFSAAGITRTLGEIDG